MNRLTKFSGLIAVTLTMVLAMQSVAGETLRDRKKSDQQEYFTTFRGKVVDSESGLPLVFATVAVQGTNIATVTNIDGEFIIKVPAEDKNKGIEFSYIGYNNKVVPFSELRENGYRNTVSLTAAPIALQEIIVKPVSPEEIVEKAIESFHLNYPSDPNLMTAFYRETIKKSRNYVAIGEAVVEVFKAPYNSDLRLDAIRIYKGRKGSDVSRMDTVLFKLQGGPVTALQLDLVKNPEAVLTKESMIYYDYALTNIIMIDDNPHFVVQFQQKEEFDVPLFYGKMFIDTRTYAVKEVEFGLDLSNKEQASALFIRKKPLGMEVTPEVATYRVSFRETDGKYYFAYSRAEVKFKVEWKKRLFNTNYTTMSEIAITDRTTEEVIKFAGKERVRYTDVFSDKVSSFSDPDFWGDYNVIEPDQSIESAIRRLSRRLRFSDLDEK
ncbi:MAG: carboxypeptidase-like regulatory domain-containing protein [Bacteroidales bacterium]|nr:carboxypeptidase-like regulatory domain-containing protein [Bacteroidales bacterium]